MIESNRTATSGEASGETAQTARTARMSPASQASRRTIWVIVLTLPVTIVALAVLLEVFGQLARLVAH